MMHWSSYSVKALLQRGRDPIDPLIVGCDVLNHTPYISANDTDHALSHPQVYDEVMSSDLPHFLKCMEDHGVLRQTILTLPSYLSDNLNVHRKEVINAGQYV